MSDDEAGHDESTARTSHHRSGTAPEVERKVYRGPVPLPAMVLRFPRLTKAVKPPLSRSQVVQHLRRAQVNRDPSRSCAEAGTDAIARRAKDDREGSPGSAASLRVSSGVEPTARNLHDNSAGRDRKGCRHRPQRGNQRRENDARIRMAKSVNQQPMSHRQTSGNDATIAQHCARHGGGHGTRRELAGCAPVPCPGLSGAFPTETPPPTSRPPARPSYGIPVAPRAPTNVADIALPPDFRPF
jgi:hypothetical protein